MMTHTLNADTVFEAFWDLKCFTDEMEDPMLSQNSGRGCDRVKLAYVSRNCFC